MARLGFRRVSGAPVAARRGATQVTHLDRDRPLVEAAQRDPAAFDALYRRYLAQVYSFAFYELGNHHDAEDATERVFLQALSALPGFEERARPADGEGASTFRVWLFQIARNAVANQRRTLRRHPPARSPPCDVSPPTGAVPWCCGSSRRCRRPRSPASWAAPRAPSGC